MVNIDCRWNGPDCGIVESSAGGAVEWPAEWNPVALDWRWEVLWKTAYQAQFLGSYSTFDNKAIWKSKVEDKHRFFAWLLVQCKLMTTDNLRAENSLCNPICSPYDQVKETTEHMCLCCVYAQEVWLLVANWTEGQVKLPSSGFSMQDWWNTFSEGSKQEG
jgi:hypothetical protein